MADNNPQAKQAEATKEAAQKRINENKQAREAQAKNAPTEGKPTPTQEENDLAAMGVHVIDKEPDGSPEQMSFAEQHKHADQQHTDQQQRQAGAKTPTPAYQTRQARPAENT